MFTLTTLPQAKWYIFGNTTNIFHKGRGITCFSNYVLDKKCLHTVPHRKSRIKTGGPPNKIFLNFGFSKNDFWTKNILFCKYLRNYSRYLTIFNSVGSSFDVCFCPYHWICSISPLLNRKIGKLAPEIRQSDTYLVTPPACFIREGVSNYVLDNKCLHTVPNRKSWIETVGPQTKTFKRLG